MFSFLGNNLTTSVTQLPAFWIFLVLIILAVVSFVYINLRQYMFKKDCNTLQANLEVGDRVKTFSGLVGQVEKIEVLPDISIVTLKTIDKDFEGYVTVDLKAICSLYDE